MMISTSSKVKVMFMTNTFRRYLTTTMMPIRNREIRLVMKPGTSIRPIIQMMSPFDTQTRNLITSTRNVTTSTNKKTNVHNKMNVESSNTRTGHIVAEEDYYHGHLIADHLEFIDDMIEKTVRMNETVQELQKTYNMKKQNIYENVNWMSSNDINVLFNTSKEQKMKLQKQLNELHDLYDEIQSLTNMVGVDGPDGTSNDLIKKDLDAVQNIIEYAEAHENKYVINHLHEKDEKARAEALRILAVDAPDGISDDMIKHDLDAVENIIEYAQVHENKDAIHMIHEKEKIAKTEALHTIAVDAPDGTPDALRQEQLNEIQGKNKHININDCYGIASSVSRII